MSVQCSLILFFFVPSCYNPYLLMYSVWEQLWSWSSGQAIGQTLARNASISWWTDCCGLSGTSIIYWLIYDIGGIRNWNCNPYVTYIFFSCQILLKVLVADINIGYEDIVNTQVSSDWLLQLANVSIQKLIQPFKSYSSSFHKCRFLLSMITLWRIWRAWPAW